MSDLVSVDDIIEKDIFELISATDLSEDQKASLYESMTETVNYRIIERIEKELGTPEKVEEWKEVGGSGDSSKTNEFLKQNNIDLEKIAVEEAINYKVEVVSLIKGTGNVAKVLEELYQKLAEKAGGKEE